MPEPKPPGQSEADRLELEILKRFGCEPWGGVPATAGGRETIVRMDEHHIRVGDLIYMESDAYASVFGGQRKPGVIQLELNRTLLTQRPTFEYGWFTAAGIAGLQAHRRLYAGKRVLDVGTGDGILALTEKELGASEVVGFDKSLPWIERAEKNAEINGLDVRFIQDEIGKATEKTLGRFDLIVTNLKMFGWEQEGDRFINLHLRLAKDFPGTRLMLAGSSNERLMADETRSVLEQTGWRIIDAPKVHTSNIRGDAVYYLAQR